MANFNPSRNDIVSKRFEKHGTPAPGTTFSPSPSVPVVNFSKIFPKQPEDFHVQPSDIKPLEKPTTNRFSPTINIKGLKGKIGTIGRKIFPPPPTYNRYEAHRNRMKKSEENIGKTMSFAAKEFIGSTSDEVWDKSDPFKYNSVFDAQKVEEDYVRKSAADAFFERLLKNPLYNPHEMDRGDNQNIESPISGRLSARTPKDKVLKLYGESPRARGPKKNRAQDTNLKLTKDFEPTHGMMDLVAIGGHLHPITDDRRGVPNNFPRPSATQREMNVMGDTLSQTHGIKPTTTPRFRLEVGIEGFENNELFFQTNDSVIIVTGIREKGFGKTAKKFTEIIELPKGLYPENIRISKTENSTLLFTES